MLLLVVGVLSLTAYLLNMFPLRNVLIVLTFLIMSLFMFHVCYKDIKEDDERNRVEEQRTAARYRYKFSSDARMWRVKNDLYEMAAKAERIEELETLLADVQVAEHTDTCGKEVIASYTRNCGTHMKVNLNIEGSNMTAVLMEEAIMQELSEKRTSLLNHILRFFENAVTQTVTETVTETRMPPRRGRQRSNVFERLSLK
jgi:hypothetical protein